MTMLEFTVDQRHADFARRQAKMLRDGGNDKERASSIRDRLIRLETARRECVEDIKELIIEAKSAGLLKEEIAGIKLAAKRHFETMEKRVFRETAESFAAALGQLSDMPLGTAAIHHHATA